MVEKMSINPNMLVWAREQKNYSVDQIAARMKRNIEDIVNWENGTDYPTYSQLETLAYDILKRPLALFFFSKAPIIDIKTNFRTLNNEVYDNLSPSVIDLINKAKSMQLNLYELGDLKQYNKIYNDKDILNIVRKKINISIEEQKTFKKPEKAFAIWRESFAEIGIYVFKDAFKDDSISGFCIYDDNYPIIYINNSMSFNRQIFTLFHELYHIISNTNGIDMIKDDYINMLNASQRKTEQLCNKFSADFLIPTSDLNKEINNIDIDYKVVEDLSKLYSASKEVVALKLYEINKISYLLLQECIRETNLNILRNKVKKDKDSDGGNYYNTQMSYLGNTYLNNIFSKLYNGTIDVFIASNYLRVKVAGVTQLESRLRRNE